MIFSTLFGIFLSRSFFLSYSNMSVEVQFFSKSMLYINDKIMKNTLLQYNAFFKISFSQERCFSLVSPNQSCLYLFLRCIDILELSERQALMKFHYHTLMLYCAVCALGNNRVAHALCSHVDESQLFYAIENTYLPGPLRSGYYDLLISIHLESAKRARLGTNKEFIVPMTEETLSIHLYPDAIKAHSLPGVGLTTCLRPKLHFSSINFVGTDPDLYTLSPVFPLQVRNNRQIEVKNFLNMSYLFLIFFYYFH